MYFLFSYKVCSAGKETKVSSRIYWKLLSDKSLKWNEILVQNYVTKLNLLKLLKLQLNISQSIFYKVVYKEHYAFPRVILRSLLKNKQTNKQKTNKQTIYFNQYKWRYARFRLYKKREVPKKVVYIITPHLIAYNLFQQSIMHFWTAFLLFLSTIF